MVCGTNYQKLDKRINLQHHLIIMSDTKILITFNNKIMEDVLYVKMSNIIIPGEVKATINILIYVHSQDIPSIQSHRNPGFSSCDAPIPVQLLTQVAASVTASLQGCGDATMVDVLLLELSVHRSSVPVSQYYKCSIKTRRLRDIISVYI